MMQLNEYTSADGFGRNSPSNSPGAAHRIAPGTVERRSSFLSVVESLESVSRGV